MFTTTLTNTTTKTVDAAVGDIFAYDAPSKYPVVYVVTEVDPAVDQPLTVKRIIGFGESGREMRSNVDAFGGYVHLRPEGRDVTTVDVEEVVATVEHKFQVGDVVQYTSPNAFQKKGQTITSIGFRPHGHAVGEAFYFYDGDTEGGDRVSNVDNHAYYGAVLVGGPRFTVEPRFKVGDKIVWKHTIAPNHYTITKVTPAATEDETAYVFVSSEFGSEFKYHGAGIPESVTYYVEPEPVVEVKPIVTLRTARDLIALPENWIKGDYDNGYGSYCALGAIRKATTVSAEREAAERAIAVALGKGDSMYVDDVVVSFNDATDRTHEQVLAAFDKAIAELVLADA